MFRVKVQVSLLVKQLRNRLFLDINLTDDAGARIAAMASGREGSVQVTFALATRIVHLHHFGEKRLIDVTLYFCALGQFIQVSGTILPDVPKGGHSKSTGVSSRHCKTNERNLARAGDCHL